MALADQRREMAKVDLENVQLKAELTQIQV